jgi:hypothetical protein
MDRKQWVKDLSGVPRMSLREHRIRGAHSAAGKPWSEGGPRKTWVYLLRDQPIACDHCGDLLSAGHKALLPETIAERLVQIGDAIVEEGRPEPNAGVRGGRWRKQ